VVEAVMAGTSHGEVCARVRAELGFGQPLVAAWTQSQRPVASTAAETSVPPSLTG